MEENEQEYNINEDSELDSIIENGINNTQAEHSLDTTTPKSEEEPEGTPTGEGSEDSPAENPQNNESQDSTKSSTGIKEPVKGASESEASFNIRKKMFELTKAKMNATSAEEQETINSQIKETRKELQNLGKENINSKQSDSDAPTNNKSTEQAPLTEDRLREVIAEEHRAQVTINHINSFFTSKKEFETPQVKEAFIELFDKNYKIDGKEPSEVVETLELAFEQIFGKKEDKISKEDVQKAAEAQGKIAKAQFDGGNSGSGNAPSLTPSQEKSIKELVGTGMSESEARSLILD